MGSGERKGKRTATGMVVDCADSTTPATLIVINSPARMHSATFPSPPSQPCAYALILKIALPLSSPLLFSSNFPRPRLVTLEIFATREGPSTPPTPPLPPLSPPPFSPLPSPQSARSNCSSTNLVQSRRHREARLFHSFLPLPSSPALPLPPLPIDLLRVGKDKSKKS